MADDDDAINEFAPEDVGEPRPADVAADLPLNAPPEVYLDAAPVSDDGPETAVEDRYFQDESGEWAEEAEAPTEEDHSYADDDSAYADMYLDQPAPIESNGRTQVVAAIATVTLLGVAYVVLFQQRSASLVSFPTSPPQAAATTEPTELASVLPPTTDEEVPLVPNVPVPRTFDDPFGLTRGLSPSSLPPPENFDARLPTATPESAPPPAAAAAAAASTPAPVAAPPPAPVAVANVAPAPVVEPPAAPPASAATASAAPAPVTTPVTTPPLATTRTAPPPTPAAPLSAVPPAAAPSAAVAAVDSNRNGIQNTLARYRKAFSSLDANAVREVWPTVNERTLSRAFDRLEQQDVSFDRCQIEVANDRAEVTCNGTARYVPRVGSRTPRVDSREWRFNLVKVREQWLIGALDAR